MLNFCGIVVAILKMATGRNFSMSEINSGHHYLTTYQILMISDNVEFLRYCGGHFDMHTTYSTYKKAHNNLNHKAIHIHIYIDIDICYYALK